MDVLAYFYPGWSEDRQINEWDTVLRAKPLFKGHRQPKLPRNVGWVENKSYMERSMDTARAAGISGFVFLIYWEQGSVEGETPMRNFLDLLKAQDDLRFSIMWVNRKMHSVFPVVSPSAYRYEPSPDREVRTDIDDLAQMMSHFSRYFEHPAYVRVEGRPLFFVYDSRSALDQWRNGSASAFDQLVTTQLEKTFLVCTIQYAIESWQRNLPKFVGATCNYVSLPDFGGSGTQSYREAALEVRSRWRKYTRHSGLPHIPSITVGWDATPRSSETLLGSEAAPFTYPRRPVVVGRSYELFASQLRYGLGEASNSDLPLVLISSFNEWSEDHALEPCEHHGDSYVVATRKCIDQHFGN